MGLPSSVVFGFRKLDVYQTRDEVIVLEELLVRIVSMLTKMTAR